MYVSSAFTGQWITRAVRRILGVQNCCLFGSWHFFYLQNEFYRSIRACSIRGIFFFLFYPSYIFYDGKFFSESIRSNNQATMEDIEKPREGTTEGQQRLPRETLYMCNVWEVCGYISWLYVVFLWYLCLYPCRNFVVPIYGKACGGTIWRPRTSFERQINQQKHTDKGDSE